MASDRSNLSRRQLLSIAGGALGVVVTGAWRVFDHASSSPGRRGGSLKPAAPTQPAVPVTNLAAPAADLGNQGIRPKVTAASPEALQVLGGVDVGTTLGQWTVVAVYDFHMGAVPVVLETANGVRYQVDVLRRDPRPQAARGVGESRQLSFFLSNEGNGSKTSNESQGLGLMALAATVRAREPQRLPSALLSLEERAARFPRGVYKVPV